MLKLSRRLDGSYVVLVRAGTANLFCDKVSQEIRALIDKVSIKPCIDTPERQAFMENCRLSVYSNCRSILVLCGGSLLHKFEPCFTAFSVEELESYFTKTLEFGWAAYYRKIAQQEIRLFESSEVEL